MTLSRQRIHVPSIHKVQIRFYIQIHCFQRVAWRYYCSVWPRWYMQYSVLSSRPLTTYNFLCSALIWSFRYWRTWVTALGQKTNKTRPLSSSGASWCVVPDASGAHLLGLFLSVLSWCWFTSSGHYHTLSRDTCIWTLVDPLHKPNVRLGHTPIQVHIYTSVCGMSEYLE